MRFPVTSGAYDESGNGSLDVYVAKFSSDLTSLSASTFLGGSGADNVYSMAIDSSDNVYVTGGSGQADDFPVTSGAYDESHNGSFDAYVSKFSSDLASLSASTYLGGSGDEYSYAIAIDSSDNVYVTGYSQYTNQVQFPTTSGAYDESIKSQHGGFVSKFSSDLASLSASTFLESGNWPDDDYPEDIAIDSSGNVYVTGNTNSDDFPVTSGAHQESRTGYTDAFVSKLSSDLTSLSASTYLGGASGEDSYAIAIDSSDNVYVTGEINEVTTPDLPATSGAYDESHNGDRDAFVSKFDFTAPTVTITSSSGDCGDSTSSTTLSYTATFSESTSNFVVGGHHSNWNCKRQLS